MKYAVIKDGVVVNAIIWDGRALIAGLEGADFIRSETANIGNTYQNGVFVAEQQPPEEIAAQIQTVQNVTEGTVE